MTDIPRDIMQAAEACWTAACEASITEHDPVKSIAQAIFEDRKRAIAATDASPYGEHRGEYIKGWFDAVMHCRGAILAQPRQDADYLAYLAEKREDEE